MRYRHMPLIVQGHIFAPLSFILSVVWCVCYIISFFHLECGLKRRLFELAREVSYRANVVAKKGGARRHPSYGLIRVNRDLAFSIICQAARLASMTRRSFGEHRLNSQ